MNKVNSFRKKTSEPLGWLGKGKKARLKGSAVVKVQMPLLPNFEQGGHWLLYDEQKIYEAMIPHDEMLSIVLDSFRDKKTHKTSGRIKAYWQCSFNGKGRMTFHKEVKDKEW